ncbi:MAG: hypothetical protein FJ109_18600 [Deltaproteobacteria bacterium]|nr:hypothetical protein [Deltaproteobacteria bacterium]
MMLPGLSRPAILCTAVLLGCVSVEEPPCPEVEIPENTGSCSTFCKCDLEAFRERVFRFTWLEIDEPEEFAGLLNPIWENDLANNVLNVVFSVVSAEKKQGSASALDEFVFLTGPGWRSPAMPVNLPAKGDLPPETAVDSYCLLEGLTQEIEFRPYHGNQCIFKSVEDSLLNFHTGAIDNPILCAPDLDPMDSIPIRNLKVRFGFNEDCTGMVDGYLEGCIAIEDANRICMCLKSGDCPVSPVPQGDYPETDLAKYCTDRCGQKWISFGASVGLFGLKPTCLTTDGKPGYRLQGFVEAHEIPGKFDSKQSINCEK